MAYQTVNWQNVKVLLLLSVGDEFIGALFDLFFVNSLGLPVNSGLVFFVVALLGALGMGVYFTHKKGRTVLNLVLLSTLMILIGYSSYASVTIRAAVFS